MLFEMIFLGAVIIVTTILAFLLHKGAREREKAAHALGISEKITRRNHLIRGVSSLSLIILLAIGFLVPVIQGYEEISVKTGDVLFLVDESRSGAAEKQLGQLNRLERAKQIMISFTDAFPNLNVAIYGFTREVRSHLFWTDDYHDFRSGVGIVSIEGVPTTGTDMGKAISSTVNYFPAASKSKIIVLLSDGENRADGNLLQAALTSAREKNVRIIVIGVGEPEGASIPIYSNSGKFLGYEKERGRVFIAYLYEQLLQEIAIKTGGVYVRENNLEEAFRFLDKNLVEEKKEIFTEDTNLRKTLLVFSLIPLFFVIIKNW